MEDILKKAQELGIIDTNVILMQIEEMEKKKYLEMHQGAIWQDSNGRWTTYLPKTDTSKRRLLKKTDKIDFEMEIIEFYRKSTNNPTIKNIFDDWIAEKLNYGEIEKQTYDRYNTDFVRFFSEFGKRKIQHVTELELEDFIKTTINKKKLSSKGWGNLRILIKGIFKYAKKHGYTQISISYFMGDLELSDKVFRKVIQTPEKSVYRDNEKEILINAIKNENVTLLTLGILLCFQTGLRVGELATLKYSDLQEHVLSVTRTEIRYKDENKKYVYEVREFTKGSAGSRQIVVTDEAIRTIKQIKLMNPFEEYLFIKKGKLMHGKAFSDKICRLCKQNGIVPKSMHKVRKTYATKLLNAGISEKLIISQMGHTDIETTKDYYWFNDYDTETAMKCIQSALG